MPPEVATTTPLAALLPAGIVSREARADTMPAVRFAVEEAAVAAAVESRRREFRTTRDCARRALEALGFPAVPIPRAPAGDPCWPAGVVGSLTHCDGYRAAAAGWRRRHAGVGIDAEPADRLPPDVLALIADPVERVSLERLQSTHPAIPWDRLLFSAKESVYKALYPTTRQWLDFGDVWIVLDPDGTFTARRRGDPVRAPIDGRWGLDSGVLLTAVVLPAAR